MKRGIRIVKETLTAFMKKQDQLVMDDKSKKKREGFQNIVKTNNEVKKVVDELKRKMKH